MQSIYQPVSGILDVKYAPDETTELIENPPGLPGCQYN